MSGGKAVLNIESVGVHTFELYMREPSYKVDKIVLTTNADYIPDEDDEHGPAETLAGGASVESPVAVVPWRSPWPL